MAGVWVFAEEKGPTLELLSVGRDLAEGLGVRVVAIAAGSHLAQTYVEHGADEVFVLPTPGENQPVESYVPLLARMAQEEDPDVLLIGASQRGKEIAARLAAQLDTGLCSGCTGIELDRETGLLIMERLLFGGAAVQRVTCATRPQMATIPPRTFDPAPCREVTGETKIRELSPGSSSNVRVISRTAKVREAVDITEARIVVCVGRGVEKAEDLSLVRELADALHGEVGCTRPIAEELHWLSEGLYLGISGKKIKPDLYIGVGVSGQIQHVTGIRDSKIIVAINCDESAPIFDAADYGIVGDLYEVVPALIEELKNT